MEAVIDVRHSRSMPWTVFDRRNFHLIPQVKSLPDEILESIRLATLVFPFKVNGYVIEHLIDWASAPDDPMFRLTFPMADMLSPAARDRLSDIKRRDASAEELAVAVAEIRAAMNPHSSDQAVNVPLFKGEPVEGLQHKYRETVLAFPKQGQTCHAYCSFCFRWPQFVPETPARFELRDATVLHDYLRHHLEVSDLLMTGGDPLVMGARRLATYLDPLADPDLEHIKVVRIGTKALTYWPYRFLDQDGDALLGILRRLVDAGKHVALMAHVNHWRELAHAPVQEAIDRLKRAGVVIRTQSPLLRTINDDSETWRRGWAEQVRLGLVPYYMFIERDTGASPHFNVPLARALEIYQQASSGVAGLAKTARGPVMSAAPGKVHILGTVWQGERRRFVLQFLQARKADWLHQLFFAEYSTSATWLDELKPADGEDSFFFEREYAAFVDGKRQKAALQVLPELHMTTI